MQQAEIKTVHGGARNGAGRKSTNYKILHDPRYLAARGVNPLKAAEILSHVIDEKRVWQRIFQSQDDRVVLQAMTFLVSMRDGKPAQQINVTSTSLHLNPGDLERARAIVAEIRGDMPSPNLPRASVDISPSGLDTPRLGTGDNEPCNSCAKPDENVESESQHNASEGRGGNADGR